MKTPIKELEILERAKAQLLEKGEINVNPSVYILEIHASDWHEIFKTDELEERRKAR